MKKDNFEDALTGIDERFLMQAAEPAVGRRRTIKKWKLLPIAAALLLAAALGISAAAPVNIGFYLKAAFGGGYEMLDAITAMPDNVAFRASGDEIRMELKGIVGDSQIAYVFADLTVSPDIAVPEQKFTLDLKLEPTGFPWEQTIEGYSSDYAILSRTDNEDGSVTFACQASIRSRSGIMNPKYTFTCRGIRVWEDSPADAVNLLSGKWSLAFELNYKDLTKSIPLDQKLNVTGVPLELTHTDAEPITKELHIYEARISPFSAAIYFEADHDYNNLLHDLDHKDTKVVLTDGTVIRHYSAAKADDENRISSRSGGGGTASHGDPYRGYVMLIFSKPIDHTLIESIWIEGYEIPLQ